MEKAFAAIWPYLLVTFIIFCLVCLIKTVFCVGWIASLGIFGGLLVIMIVRCMKDLTEE